MRRKVLALKKKCVWTSKATKKVSDSFCQVLDLESLIPGKSSYVLYVALAGPIRTISNSLSPHLIGLTVQGTFISGLL
jgi:hypothetical protein